MANTVQISTLLDGTYNVIFKVDLIGDGSGEESGLVIYNPATHLNKGTYLRFCRIHYQLTGFSAFLEWEGTTDKQLVTLAADHHENQDYRWDFEFGGLNNGEVAGKTGKILLSTVGLGDDDRGHIIIHLQHKD